MSDSHPQAEVTSVCRANAVQIQFVLFFSFIFVLVFFSDFLPTVYGAYGDQRIVLSICLIALSALGLYWMASQQTLKPIAKELWPFALVISSFLFSAVQYRTDAFSLIEPVFYSLYFIAFGFFGYVIRVAGWRRAAVESLVVVTAVVCFFYAAMTLTVYFFAVTDGFSKLGSVIPWGFVNIRYWSHTATWLVPLFPLFLLVGPFRQNRLWQFGAVFTSAIWWWLLFMSTSRGSIIALFLGLLSVWALFGNGALPWVKRFIAFAAYGFLAWVILSLVIPSIVFEDLQVRGVNVTSSGRMPLWSEAWAMSVQHFPLGMGPQSWLTHDTITEAYRAVSILGHPHNMYLMWAAEYGWISIGALLVLAGFVVNRLVRRAAAIRAGAEVDAVWLVAFTGSVIAALLHAGASAVFIAPGSMLIGMLVLSMFWALVQQCASRGSEFKNPPMKSARLFRYVICIAFVAFCFFWLREVFRYQQAAENDLAYYQENISLGHLPRFWLHGYFPRGPLLMPNQVD